MAVGRAGRPYCGYGCLTGQGNGQGGREHGQKADQLPGYRRLDNPADRAHVAKVWGVREEELPAPSPRAEPRNAADHWTRPILLERAAYLVKLARYGEGSASETIKEFPHYSVMLSVRSRSGEAEVHENFAHIFLVFDGSATLESGGTLVGSKHNRPGEIRGGTRCELRAGDVAHVPAGQPYQFLVGGERAVICLVIKVQETPSQASF